jgi:hypothetical protein
MVVPSLPKDEGDHVAWQLWDQSHAGIYVDNSRPGFFASCGRDLNLIRSRTIGKTLLEVISKRARGIGTKAGKFVCIGYTDKLGSVAQSSVTGNQEERKNAKPGSVVRLPGVGDSSVVLYGDNLEPVYTSAIGIYTPEFVALAHELIHALHVISGDVVKEYDWGTDGAIIEEARTVGLGPYANTRISENSIRKEWNLGRRTYYHTPGDADGLVATT